LKNLARGVSVLGAADHDDGDFDEALGGVEGLECGRALGTGDGGDDAGGAVTEFLVGGAEIDHEVLIDAAALDHERGGDDVEGHFGGAAGLHAGGAGEDFGAGGEDDEMVGIGGLGDW